jgi:glycosyltransferase involved in cell wall biosynthesis
MACGCPVVVSNAASLPEVCGDAGVYVDPNDVSRIAEGICKVLTDSELKRGLVEKGFERARLFGWEKTAKETLEIFSQVLAC